MPFEVLIDEAAIMKDVGETKDDAGNTIGFDHETRVWFKGDIVPDEEVAATVIRLYEEGDEHTKSVIKRVRKAAAKPSEAGDGAE